MATCRTNFTSPLSGEILGRASGNSCRPAAVPALENPGASAAPPSVGIAPRTCQLTLDRRAPLAGALQGAQRSPCRTVISMSDGAAAAAFRHELELQTEVASLRSGRARERRLRCSAIARASSSSRRCSCSSREDAVVPGGSGQGWGRQDRERSGRGHRVPGCTREGQPRMVCGEGTRCRMPSCAPYMYFGVVWRVR